VNVEDDGSAGTRNEEGDRDRHRFWNEIREKIGYGFIQIC